MINLTQPENQVNYEGLQERQAPQRSETSLPLAQSC